MLTAEQIIDKPALNPGSFLDLAKIFPGFQENPTSGQNNPTASSGSSINFNGTGHARRDVPDQRRQQRRLVREPEPPGRVAVDDQGVPGHQQHATAPSSAAATARSCWCRRSRAPTSGTATPTGTSRTATT